LKLVGLLDIALLICHKNFFLSFLRSNTELSALYSTPSTENNNVAMQICCQLIKHNVWKIHSTLTSLYLLQQCMWIWKEQMLTLSF